jgi:flagellar hook-basal body protein
VAGEGGPITVPASAGPQSIQIASDGTVTADGQRVGKLRVMSFADPSLLRPVGEGSFMADAGAQPVTASDVQVRQGYKEASNVNLVEELVELIKTTRLFEANLKAISTGDDRMQSILEVAMS